jgi:hypothetical protein
MEFALKSNTGGVPRVLDRRISNAGSVADIRKRDPQQIFKSGGITKFSTLGSQNAISYVPIAYPPPKKEAGTQTDTGTGTDKPILPGKSMDTGTGTETEPAPEKSLIGGEGGKQSEESISESAVQPSHDPPYYLPQEQGQLDEMKQFLKQRYGEKETRREIDFLDKDSKNFSLAVEKAKEIGRQINEWKQKDLGKEDLTNKLKSVAGWFLDKVVDFGTGKIDFKTKDEDKPKGPDGKIDKSKINQPKEVSLGIATEIAKAGVNELKKLVKETYLKPESYEATMKAIQDTLFAQKPDWKAKWNALLSAEIEKNKKMMREYIMKFGEDNQIPDAVKDKVPFGYMGGKKKDAEPEPKKRKVRKSMPMKI